MNYYELEPEDNIFKTLSIPLTYRCQLSCANCYLGDMLNNTAQYPDIDFDRFINTISRLPSRTDIRFIGAEPTLHPRLFDFIKAVRDAGHRPSLLTNGIRLKNERYVAGLKDAGLNMLGLSMNGGLDDDVYQLFDGGKYAKPKMLALENCFKHKILPHINVIVTPDNVHVLKLLYEYIIETALKFNVKFSPIKFPVALRVKSVGQMGYHMNTTSYELHELINVVTDAIGVSSDDLHCGNIVDGNIECNSVVGKYNTRAGVMLGKFTDWNVDDEGVPDSGSTRRGIMTPEFKVAPFFEYYRGEMNDLQNN